MENNIINQSILEVLVNVYHNSCRVTANRVASNTVIKLHGNFIIGDIASDMRFVATKNVRQLLIQKNLYLAFM